MALSKYNSTEETTNLARVARVFLGPCTDILRDVLYTYKKPDALQQSVNSYLNNYPPDLKPPINKKQWDIINGENYKQFDISLLYVLLRNVCGIAEHSGNWGFEPPLNDDSLAALIERIHLHRNTYYGHVADFSISNNDFIDIWECLSSIVTNLKKKTNIKFTCNYEEEMETLRKCDMDPTSAQFYIKKLLVLEQLEERVEDLERKNSTFSTFDKNRHRIS